MKGNSIQNRTEVNAQNNNNNNKQEIDEMKWVKRMKQRAKEKEHG